MAIILASISVIRAQSFYLCQGEKVNLRIDSTMYAVQNNKNNYDKQLSVLNFKQQNNEIKSFQKISDDFFLVEGREPIRGVYNYYSNVYLNNDNKIVIIMPRIIVMFKDDKASQVVMDSYKTTMVKDKGSKQKYVFNLIVSSSKEVLELASEIDSRDDVIWCEPVFYSEYSLNNSLYTQQYYLNNTGQNGGTAGIDINVEPAWSITNGSSSVTVTVIDEGVERNHEDFGNRILDGLTLNNPSGLGEPQNANELDTKYHGTACAGIIAASNNLIGIRGVASNVNILPVNIVPFAAYLYNGSTIYGFGNNEDIADAINWAWHRSDILSLSLSFTSSYDPIIFTELDSAMTYGRNGKGSIVVCASGNSSADVTFPANIDGVITVGAVNKNGIIWNYSCTGPSMDVVAPSGLTGGSGDITTTDLMGNLGLNAGNYVYNFGGTSAACPQISGIVALMLSVNPNLSVEEVREILQQTATDLGDIGFDNTYGYGLANSYGAVVRAATGNISGPSTLCGSNTSYYINSLPSGVSVNWSCSSNISYISGQGTSNCIFKAYTNGLGWIKASLITSNGTFEITKTVDVGLKATFSGSTTIPVNGSGTWTANPTCGNVPYTYQWFLRKEGTGMEATQVGNESTLTLWSLPVLKSMSPGTYETNSENNLSENQTKQPSTRTYFRLFLRVRDANNAMYETAEQRITAYGNVDLISRYLKSGNNVEEETIDTANEFLINKQETPELTIYLAPNPAGEWVDITVDGLEEFGGGYRVEFVNSMSRIIKTLRLDNSYNRVSIGHLANGYYVVRVIAGKEVASKILLVDN